MTEYYRGMFLYRGDAVGIAGSFFPVQAPSSLPTIGGKSSAHLSGFIDRNSGVKCEQIWTSATGSFNAETQSYETFVESRAQGFRFQDKCAVEDGWVRLSSHHDRKGQSLMDIRMELPKVLEFEFAGFPARAYFHEEILGLTTKQGFLDALKKPAFSKAHAGKFFRARTMSTACLLPTEQIYTEVSGYLIYSPVARVEWEGEGREGNHVQGHTLTSAKVGTCYVAETYRDSISCRTNLLRFYFGKTEGERIQTVFSMGMASGTQKGQDQGDGEIVIGATGTNGVVIPP